MVDADFPHFLFANLVYCVLDSRYGDDDGRRRLRCGLVEAVGHAKEAAGIVAEAAAAEAEGEGEGEGEEEEEEEEEEDVMD